MVDVTLEDLEPHERLAFAGLVRMMVRADGVLSAAESSALSTLARDVGSLRFWRCMSEAQQALPDTEDVSDAARNVTRPHVRAWTYAVLLGMAAADGNVGQAEGHLLDWLQVLWEL